MFGHPSFDALKRFADAEEIEGERPRIARHLEKCGRCRDEILALRELRAEARALHAPPLPGHTLDRVLARRAAGERLLLPAVDARPAPVMRKPAALAAAAILVIAVALLSPTEGLKAAISGGQLVFSDSTPGAGARLDATYLAPAALAEETRLLLRAQLVAEGFTGLERPAVVIAELRRGRDGRFTGSFTLPDSIIYAAFAVEDMSGAHVDANGRAYWELLVHDAQERPLEPALWQRYRSSLGRDWMTGDRTIRRMVQLYPRSPRALRFLYANERQRLGQVASDSLAAAFRPRFEALHDHYSLAPIVSSDVAFEMVFLADTFKDRERHSYWRERAMREHPRAAGTVQQKVFALRERKLPAAEAVAAAEALWQEHGNASPQLRMDGWQWAARSGDAAASRRWGERLVGDNPDWSLGVGQTWVAQEALREEGLNLLRRGLIRLDSLHDYQRPLDHTVPEFRRARAGWKQSLLLAIAGAYLDAGNFDAARDTLQHAATLGWNARIHRALARAALAAGDTALAVRSLARVAADPSTARTWADSVRAAHASHASPADWDSWLAAADSAMRIDILARSRHQPIPAEMHVLRSDGSRLRLAFGEERRVAVVVFISRLCPPSNEQLPLLAQAGSAIERLGARLLVVTDEAPSAALQDELNRRGYEGPVLHDVHAELSRGLRQFGTPQFFVIDANGVLRQDTRSLDTVLQMVSALQGVSMKDVPRVAGPARAAMQAP